MCLLSSLNVPPNPKKNIRVKNGITDSVVGHIGLFTTETGVLVSRDECASPGDDRDI